MNYYEDHSRVSNSMLGVLKKSAELYYLRYVLGIDKQKDTPEIKLGRFVHALILEPDTVTDKYACVPKVDRRTKDGKAIYERIVCEHQGKELIDYESWQQAMQMAEAVRNHGECKQVFRSQYDVELELTFNLFDTPCKSKLDLFNPSRNLILDVKTIADSSQESFEYSVRKYGYCRQAAIYSKAVELLYNVRPRFIFAVVSSSEPYIAACYEPDSVFLDIGLHEASKLLDELRRRTEQNDWTSDYAKGVNVLSPSKYHFS
jgi:exodeoxyribonuclease VIII